MSEREPRTRTALPGSRGDYVLLAMPSATRAATYQSVLADAGVEVTLVRDGEEARRELATQGAPTLLILDLSLPKVDGFELVRELRSIAGIDKSGAIVVSGHAAILEAARRMSGSLGISRVLPLDIDRRTLREAIDGALQAGAQPRPLAFAPLAEKRREPVMRVDQLIEAAVLSAAQRFGTAITVAYVRLGVQEIVRGSFGVTDPSGPLDVSHVLTFLRQVANGTDPLIVPDTETYAVSDLAPRGLAICRGFAAAPLAAPGAVTGALCVMDTKPLQMDAEDLNALEALGRDLGRNLTPQVEPPAAATPEGAGRTPSPVDIDSLERLASADPLTGLSNRRGGEKDIAAEISRARRQNTPLSCVLIDLDHFKQVNDTYGHQAGDYVLREIGALLRRTLRAYDILIRWGGEEFLIVLPAVAKQQAFMLGERVRVAIEGLRLAGIPGVTASVGVASLGSDFSFETMFASADRQLYRVKNSGRNSVA